MSKNIIKKENMINEITSKCNNEYISLEDLLKLVDKISDKKGNVSQKKLSRLIKSSNTKMVVKDIYDILESSIFEYLSSVDE